MEKNSIRRGVAKKKIEKGAQIFITVKDFFFASCGLIKCLFLWLRRKKNKDLIYRDVGFVQYSKKKKVHNSDIRPFFFLALENVVQNHLFHLVFWRWENVNIFWVFYCPPFSLFLKTFEFW